MAFLFPGRKLPCSTVCPLEFIFFSPGRLDTAQCRSIGTVVSLSFKSLVSASGRRRLFSWDMTPVHHAAAIGTVYEVAVRPAVGLGVISIDRGSSAVRPD